MPELNKGTKIQKCTVCGEFFSTNANGDKHRKVVSTYDIWLTPSQELLRLQPQHKAKSPEDDAYVTAHRQMGFTLMSRGNQVRECVDPATVGLELKDNGGWGQPSNDRWDNK